METKNNTYLKKHTKLLTIAAVVSLAILLFGASYYARAKNKPVSPYPKTISVTNRVEKQPRSTLNLSPAYIKVQQNQEFTIDLLVHAFGETVNGVDAVLQYDPKVIALVKIDPIKDTNNKELKLVRKLTDGYRMIITMVKDTASDTPLFSAKLAKITLRAIAPGSHTITFEHYPSDTKGSTVIRASNNENILDRTTGATILVE